MMAERSPTVFMDIATPWSEQTGTTLISEIRDEFKQTRQKPGPNISDKEWDKHIVDLWKATTDDLVFVQNEARGRTSEQIKSKRDQWEEESKKQNLDSNVYGDFSKDRTDIQLTKNAGGETGYVITDDFIKEALTQKYHAKGMSKEATEEAVARVIQLRKRILTGILEKPKMPDFKILKKDFLESLKGNKKKFKETSDEWYNSIKNMTEEEFNKFALKNLVTRSKLFRARWNSQEFGFEPEVDMAEHLTLYNNGDANHFGRMTDDINTATVKTKADMDPNAENSINEMIKNFAKDPFGAIDKMSEYLNPYRKALEAAKGKTESGQYVAWYVNRVLQANLKEDIYRGGFMGAFRDVRNMVFAQNKTSLGTSVNQPYSGKSLSALMTHRVIRYLIQKKLIGPEQGDDYMKRYRGTVSDIFKENFARGAIVIGAAAVTHVVKSASDGDANLK
jgi:hypothetical protein